MEYHGAILLVLYTHQQPVCPARLDLSFESRTLNKSMCDWKNESRWSAQDPVELERLLRQVCSHDESKFQLGSHFAVMEIYFGMQMVTAKELVSSEFDLNFHFI